ncbi:ribosomal protein L11 methyltransferase [Methanobrevibacter cuticularis]|uniref:Ribosomal protein L11 methyltransferase n=1 Tax=Methanobrevibacter cuticularis TaxID=47311 RepID=A0A166DEQ4_9EURY|nr:methyltransferase [Methanobrevibacter cuticularis]KZX15515.1 ribosomal protein L11 methyltransferase [Methanobrevibacter cuticularis]
MELKCSCNNNCIIHSKDIEKRIKDAAPCSKCVIITLKKFKQLSDQICVSAINNEFGRCVCGKRSIDITMAHILKIMVDEGIDPKSFNLRNGAIPLSTPLESEQNPQLTENSLIILHPDFNEKIAKRIMDEVKEVKGVLKGNSKDIVGIIDIGDECSSYELLAGCDFRCDIIKTPLGAIAINKKQHAVHLEFSASTENKILKIDNYFKTEHLNKEDLPNLTLIDATCGCGALGIYSLNYGFGNVTFNDINRAATEITAINLEANGYEVDYILKDNGQSLKENGHSENNLIAKGETFEVYNSSIEELSEKLSGFDKNSENNAKFDYCILDSFPQVDNEYFREIAEKIAKNIIII